MGVKRKKNIIPALELEGDKKGKKNRKIGVVKERRGVNWLQKRREARREK